MRLLKFELAFLVLLAGASSLFAVLGLLSRYDWFCELCSHFYLEYGAAVLVAIAGFALARKWRHLLLFVPFFILCVFKVAPIYLPVGSSAASVQRIKVASCNVNSANRQFAKTIDWVKKTQPDVVAFEETDRTWIDALTKGLANLYPYHRADAGRGSFGITLFSKFPIENTDVLYLASRDYPAINARLNLNGKEVNVLAVHPVPPFSPPFWQLRSKQMQQIVEQKNLLGDNFIVLGDFNSSAWSSDFQQLLTGLNAKDSRQGFGLQLSWPTYRVGFFLSTTIDHILTSQNLQTVQRGVGPNIGSDHYPIYAVISVP